MRAAHLRQAAAAIEADLDRARTSSTLGAAASLQLYLHRPAEALALLDEAAALRGADPRLVVDRAAAVLELDGSRPGGAADELAATAELMDRPPLGDPELAARWRYNHALLLERLGLETAAADDLRAVTGGGELAPLAAEGVARLQAAAASSRWDAGDRQLLANALARDDAAAVSRLVDRWPLAAATQVEETILAEVAGNADRLRQAELIATALARRGDPFLSEVVAGLRADPSPDLRAAHADYGRARALEHAGKYEQALPLFTDAAGAFTHRRSPFRWLASHGLATCLYRTQRPAAGLELLRSSLHAAPKRYHHVQARLEWLAGIFESVLGDPAASLDEYSRAFALYRDDKNDEGMARLEMLTAEGWWTLGEWRQAWRHRRQALARLRRVADPQLQRTILDEAADASGGDGFLALAGMLQDSVVESARTAHNDYALPVALAQRAHISLRRRLWAAATADLAAARGGVEAIAAGKYRQNIDASVAMVEAEALARNEPQQAIRKLAAATVFYEESNNWVPLRTAAMLTASCYLRLGDHAAALEALKRAEALGERVRRQSPSERVRAALDNGSQQLYGELVRLALDRGGDAGIAEAFDYSELSRARRLADSLGASQVELSDLSRALPAGTAMVVYEDLGSALVAFVVRADRDPAVVTLDRQGLTADVALVRRSLAGRSADVPWKQGLASLWRRLVAPLEPRLGGISSLVVVPHRELVTVPFAALFDPRRQRYLIEDYRLQIAPSATAFVNALAQSRQRQGPPAVLAVAAGESSGDLASVLPRLPRANAAARAVAARYPHADLLIGAAATRDAFLSAAARSTIIHFDGHSVASAVDPSLSFLALTASKEDAGILYAQDIAKQRWPSAQLVFLASCHTAQGRSDDAEGIQGLARAFLAAGVPAVIGTLWDVDDRLAETVSLRFHEHYATGSDAASALRSALLSVLANERQAPPAWAAFEVIGGVAEPTIH
ncbi:MAG TPA: CHAT domain-containing protein [Thermoanaerobaculia bacterium]|nr:CHAT domain-containing protein [Thermoanaerobaculia bacterium]